MRQIIYGNICLLGNPRFLKLDVALNTWYLDEAACDAEFKAVANAGANGIRLLAFVPRPWYQGAAPFNPAIQFQPYALSLDRKKYDLSKFNAFYFPVVKRVVQLARARGLRTWFVWLDNCGVMTDKTNYRVWNPWVTNAQGVATFYDPKAVPFIKAWIQRCHMELSPYYVNWCWGNETTPAAFRDVAKNAIHPMVTKLAIPARNMAYGATMAKAKYDPKVKPPDGPYLDTNDTQAWLKADAEEAFGLAFKKGIWKEVHGVGATGYPAKPNFLDQALTWWARAAKNGIRIWLSDDGTKTGDSICDKAADGARPSAARWTAMVKATLPFVNDFTYEHLPQNETAAGLSCQVATLRAMYRAMTGTDPVVKYR